MQIRINGIFIRFFLHNSKNCSIFAARNPTRGCLHIGGGFCRHIKKAFISALFWLLGTSQLSRILSGLSNDRCPTGYRLSLLCLFWYMFGVYSYTHMCTLTMWRESIFYIRRGLRVVSSIRLGNAKASESGTGKRQVPRFFCEYLCTLFLNRK